MIYIQINGNIEILLFLDRIDLKRWRFYVCASLVFVCVRVFAVGSMHLRGCCAIE